MGVAWRSRIPLRPEKEQSKGPIDHGVPIGPVSTAFTVALRTLPSTPGYRLPVALFLSGSRRRFFIGSRVSPPVFDVR